MGEPNNPQRPNAKYDLSNENVKIDPDEGLKFYYNRERRLEKAPKAVKDLYTKDKQKFNLLRPLIADKPRAMIFFTIIILCVVIIMLSLMGFFDKAHTLEGNKLEITGTRFEGSTIIIIKKTVENKQNAYTGAVDIGVAPVLETALQEGDEPDYYSHRIFFTLEQEEERRFVVPFDTPELAMVIQTEKSSLKLKFKPD